MKTKLTPFSKLLIVVVVLVGLGLLFNKYKDQIMPSGEETNTNENEFVNEEEDVNEDVKLIKIGVVTWGGYAGGQYFNEGFKANKKSRFYKDYGFMVEFRVLDDFVNSREVWKAGKVDLLWATIDAFTTEVEGLKEFEPQVIFQADWSRGGDAIVARRGINSVKDLKGKTVAFAEMTPSHTFLLWLLEAGSLNYKDIKIKPVASAIDAAELFKAGEVDAAVVWSPDDALCVEAVKGSKVLQSTKDASHIIADIFVAKKKYVENNKKELKQLMEGWFKGAAEINTNDKAKRKAAKILNENFEGVDEEFTYNAINNVRLCTYGDNLNFFNLNRNYSGMTGENIYNKMKKKYKDIGIIDGRIQPWRTLANSSLVKSLDMNTPGQNAEGSKEFTEATDEVKTSAALSTKGVPIYFRTGEFKLDENAKYIIDNEFLDLAKSFANARIRIEGNTDNVGNRTSNITLSKNRANSVVRYLVSEHGFNKKRFIVAGNGPDNPVDNNNTEKGREKNRRTDFEILSN